MTAAVMMRFVTARTVISIDLIGLDRQDLPCTHLAHHKPEDITFVVIIMTAAWSTELGAACFVGTFYSNPPPPIPPPGHSPSTAWTTLDISL